MKKLIFKLAILLSAAFAVSSCISKPQELIMATGGVSGTYYSFGAAMTGLLNNRLNVSISVSNTGASKENLRLLANKEAQLAIVQNDSLYYANTGSELFEGEQLDNISVIARLYPEVCQIVASPEAGIDSVADMRGKRISIGDVGSGVEANALQILEIYALTKNDIDAVHLSFAESAEAYINNEIDGFFVTSGIPNTAITELTKQRDIKILSLDDDKIQALIDKYPFYAKEIIPQQTYGLSRDIATVSVQAVLACPSDLNRDLVYSILKTLFEDPYSIGHAKAEEMFLTRAVDGVEISTLHPGALKFFREVGIVQ